MKVLEVVASLNSGGVENLLRNYINNINVENIRFDFIVHGQQKGLIEDFFLQQGCAVYHVIPASENFIKHFSQIDNILKKNKYDIIQIHQGNLSWPILILAKKNKIKVRIAHSHQAYRDKSNIKTILYTKLTDFFATDLWACGQEAGRNMWGSKSFYLMKNAIEVEKFRFDLCSRNALRKEFNVSDDELLVGHIGRYTFQKNHEFIVEITRYLSITNQKIKILLIGDGPNQSKIRDLVVANKLQKYVIFAGVRTDVNKCLSAMDIFILPSRFEGLPVVMIEAQSNGLPIIASDQITQEIKIFDNVTYLPIKDPKYWAEKIIENRKMRILPESAINGVKVAGYDIHTEVDVLLRKYKGYF